MLTVMAFIGGVCFLKVGVEKIFFVYLSWYYCTFHLTLCWTEEDGILHGSFWIYGMKKISPRSFLCHFRTFPLSLHCWEEGTLLDWCSGSKNDHVGNFQPDVSVVIAATTQWKSFQMCPSLVFCVRNIFSDLRYALNKI